MLVYQRAQAFFQDMSVDLGGGNISMTQQLLYRLQIRSAFEQVTGKGMTQYVRRNRACVQACITCKFL